MPNKTDSAMRNPTDKANYERLQKDVSTVKNDIAALTDQITDALNAFAGQANKQAKRGYRQARDNMDSTFDDMSDRGSAMMSAAQDAAGSIEESLEDVIAQRPLVTVGLALGLGVLIGAMWRR
ncbi:MAG TPA: DUF883 domain-containing protein [Bradyrhizobium sp.]|jgi:ElaB/YqjD/DUF883 family membrane-anchored ribosome-binding protein|nr:DUF883 domain-containing protein [Bradyrhizobium sp.]